MMGKYKKCKKIKNGGFVHFVKNGKVFKYVYDKNLDLISIIEYKADERKIICFSQSGLISKLVGEHNEENIAAAIEAAGRAGIEDRAIGKAVKEFILI